MSFVEFMAVILFCQSGLLLLLGKFLRVTVKSNAELRAKLKDSEAERAEFKGKLATIAELEARVPKIEPAWGSDSSGEPSRENLRIAEEREIIAILEKERKAIEASLRNPGLLFKSYPAKGTKREDNDDFYDYRPAKKVREAKAAVNALTFPEAERRVRNYYANNFGNRWLKHTLKCIDVKDDEIDVMGSLITYGVRRTYIFSTMVVEK